jgi:redox-sensitive bicupin YhaK (pirin superfamily)
MIVKRSASERGGGNHGWLDTRHSFSFNDYYDPQYIGFRVLRVINEDRVQPGQGFGTHGHRDMEILSYVLEGQLEHKDDVGHGTVLRPGEMQYMSAGTGIRHSEFNPSKAKPVHFYQVGILPDRRSYPPAYQQRSFPEAERGGRLRLVAARGGRDGALTIRQDAEVFLSSLESGQQVTHSLRDGRHAWVQVLRGAVQLNRRELAAGDGAAVSDETLLAVAATRPAEIMLFDLP